MEELIRQLEQDPAGGDFIELESQMHAIRFYERSVSFSLSVQLTLMLSRRLGFQTIGGVIIVDGADHIKMRKTLSRASPLDQSSRRISSAA